MSVSFPMGRLVATPAVLAAVPHEVTTAAVARHLSGDWGDLDEHDKRMNEEALKIGERIFSSYKHGDEKFWIITEADRSATTILLPSDY